MSYQSIVTGRTVEIEIKSTSVETRRALVEASCSDETCAVLAMVRAMAGVR